MPVWGAILMAVVATSLMNFSLALQKKGAEKLPKLGKEKGAFGAFFKNTLWLAGFGGLLLGWGLYFASAKFAPISIIQPTLGVGLVVLAIFSIFYLNERMTLLEWVAIIGMVCGMFLLGLSAGEEERNKSILPIWSILLIITGSILVFSFLAYILGKKGMLGAIKTESLLGIVTGLFIGLAALYTKAMFLHLDAKQNIMGFGICLPALIAFNLLGIGIMQSGFQHGRAMIVVALEAVLNKVVAIVGGMLALGEHLPEERELAFMRVIAFILILSGTAILSRFGGNELAEKNGG